MNPDWQQQLVAKLPDGLRRDPKKTLILGVLVVVMLGVMVKQFVLNTPTTAAASAASPASSALAYPSSASKTPSANGIVRDAGRIDPVEEWLAGAMRPPERNIFEFHPEFFQTIGVSTVAPKVRVVQEELFWDRLAKSIASRADQRKQRQIRIENLQVAAGKLRVQSTIMGANPRVVIAGKMHGVGDTVEAESGGVMLQFRLARIEGRRIILEREGVKLELPMGADRARVIVDE